MGTSASGMSHLRALVVGASRGSGRAIALELAARGAGVGLVARGREALDALAGQVLAAGGRAHVAPADVQQEPQVEAAVRSTLGTLGGLDALIYCAGVGLYGPLERYSLDRWRATLDTNLTGLFLCARAVLPHLRQHRHGFVIALSSGAGKQGYANLAAYSASKFGLMGFMQSLALEVGDDGIKVSTIVPGSILTEFGSRTVEEKRASGNKYLAPDDVAQAVLCLLQQSERAWTQEMNLWPFREPEGHGGA